MYAYGHFEAEAGKLLYLIKDQQNYIIAGRIFRKNKNKIMLNPLSIADLKSIKPPKKHLI